MVHTDDIHIENQSETKDTTSNCKYDENGVLQPEWKIDDDGIPYCKCLDDYDKIVEMDIKHRFHHEFEGMLNCKRCSHYKNDDCFFPREEIDKIEHDRLHKKHGMRCVLCGNKIDRPWSVLMSYYYEEKFGVHIPVICCMCYKALENDSYEKNVKRRIVLFLISLFTSIYFISTYFVTIFVWNYIGIFLFIIPFAFWGYISIRDIKNLYHLYRGRKYYREIMNAQKKKPEEPSRREKMLDEDDKKKPKKGAFDASGLYDE